LGVDEGVTLEIEQIGLEDCDQARGTVVVIDVVRAFTTAAHAFAAGAREITLVSTVSEAFALKKCDPSLLLMGEERGGPIRGFDHSNSPAALAGADLTGRRLVQRTSHGTQGVVCASDASLLLAASFVNAAAIAQHLRSAAVESVTFLITGRYRNRNGDEDAACADYITALLRQEDIQIEPLLERVRRSRAGRLLLDPERPEYPEADLPYCLAVDRFDLVLRVTRRDGLPVMAPVQRPL
jgi:2-phosphosulfolactate phosphatase